MFNDASFRKYNLWVGWAVFIFSAIVYCLTIEPTASFWDCGEYIACSYGIETGHPPGAPLFLLIAKFFSLFSFGNREHVAACINTMSALASAFTALFLFWSITHLAKKIILKTEEELSKTSFILIFAAGVVGALSYAFTDSAWFSAEEGEVYALSSLFTAAVFWAMLKWENVADEPHSDRWLVFIAFLIGLSIGVHLLNLLTIPALVFIWYFRKKPITITGLLITLVVAVGMLGTVQSVLIPGIVKLAGKTELYFVNHLGMAFNSGTIFYFVMLIVFIVAGLMISHRRRIIWLNTAILCFTVLLIGYSSFFVLVIRSQAGTPINEDNPSNAISLLSYLNREQYGDWPLLYGQNYNTPLDAEEPYLDGEPVYVRDDKSGKYIVSDARKGSIENYDSRGCTFFPRMYSSGHASAYSSWGLGVKGTPVDFATKRITSDGRSADNTINIPTFAENFQFFITYQCGWMYSRYFMWNFVGRQNDHLGGGNDAEGNWLSGIPFLDNNRLGDQKLLPQIERDNKARNRYFGIPFLLGLMGIFFHFAKSKRDAFVVSLLFLCTGLAIVFYLNQTPWQPRERDYAYVGSFYAFSIWVGLGVFFLYDLFRALKNPLVAVSISTALSLCSPFILLAQNWDDHNRSGRTVASDVATNFLKSCAPNAILFTYADNDTFPLWYAQEVLGVRKDVRIICLSLFRSDWYIDQAKKKQYTSDPLPISLTHWQYRDGTRDYMNIFEDSQDTMDLRDVVRRFTTSKFDERFVSTYGDTLNYIPTRNMSLVVNKKEFQKTNTLNDYMKGNLEDTIHFRLRGNYLLKDQIIILDILAHNDWKRPVYFAVNMPNNAYAGLDDYLQLEGMAYRLVPVKNPRESGSLQSRPQVSFDKSYHLVMDSFAYGGIKNPKVYADETTQRMFSDPVRLACSQIATALAEAGQKKKAIDVITKCTTEIPASQIAPDNAWLEMINTAYFSDDKILAEKLSHDAFDYFFGTLRWYQSIKRTPGYFADKRDGMFALIQMAEQYGDHALAEEFQKQMATLNIEMPPPTPEPVDDAVPDSAPDSSAN